MKLMKTLLLTGIMAITPLSQATVLKENAINSGQINAIQTLETKGFVVNVLEDKEIKTNWMTLSVNGSIAYLDESGDHLFAGAAFDMKNGMRNITQELASYEAYQDVINFRAKDLIKYPSTARESIGSLYVFTDTTCPYCRNFHKEIESLNTAGIDVHYLPFPREMMSQQRGQGYREMLDTVCADDPAKRVSVFMHQEATAKHQSCESGEMIVEESFKLGAKIGISGTPAMLMVAKSTVKKEATAHMQIGYIQAPIIIEKFKSLSKAP